MPPPRLLSAEEYKRWRGYMCVVLCHNSSRVYDKALGRAFEICSSTVDKCCCVCCLIKCWRVEKYQNFFVTEDLDLWIYILIIPILWVWPAPEWSTPGSKSVCIYLWEVGDWTATSDCDVSPRLFTIHYCTIVAVATSDTAAHVDRGALLYQSTDGPSNDSHTNRLLPYRYLHDRWFPSGQRSPSIYLIIFGLMSAEPMAIEASCHTEGW